MHGFTTSVRLPYTSNKKTDVLLHIDNLNPRARKFGIDALMSNVESQVCLFKHDQARTYHFDDSMDSVLHIIFKL